MSPPREARSARWRGVGYAALMLLGLRTWWLPAIGTPFLTLHVEWQSPAMGFASGLALAAVAIWLAARRVGRIAPRRLMAGDASTQYTVLRTQHSVSAGRSAICNLQFAIRIFQLFLSLCSCWRSSRRWLLLLVPLEQDAKVGAFFGAGSWTLVTLLALVYRQLRRARPARPSPAAAAICCAWRCATRREIPAAARWPLA